MKDFVSIALLCSTLAHMPALAQAPADSRAGTVRSVRGTVQVLSIDAGARPVRTGEPVAPIDRIVTEADSAASLVLRDGTAIVLGPSSRLDLKQFHFDKATREGALQILLLRGSLRMVTGLIGKTHPDAVRVETQTASIGVRGTDFIVEAEAQP